MGIYKRVSVVCIGGREVRHRSVKMECKWSLLINVHGTCSITLKCTDINKHGYEDPSCTNTTINNTDNKTISDKDMGGNRGFNTQQVHSWD